MIHVHEFCLCPCWPIPPTSLCCVSSISHYLSHTLTSANMWMGLLLTWAYWPKGLLICQSNKVNPTFQSILKKRFSKCSASTDEDLCQGSQAACKFFFCGSFQVWWQNSIFMENHRYSWQIVNEKLDEVSAVWTSQYQIIQEWQW